MHNQTIPSPEASAAEDEAAGIVDDDDYQLSQALNLLKGLQIIGSNQAGDPS